MPEAASSSSLLPWATILPVADHDQLVGDRLDLAQQVRGEQHGAAAVGEVAQQPAHPGDALRVEAVGRLVEDQHARVAEQRVRDAEPLAHAERVGADALARRRAREADAVEQLVDLAAVDAEHLGATASSVSRPVRPACWAEASSSTPTWRPGSAGAGSGVPSTVAVPGGRRVSPQIMRRVVDLPAPLGPRNPVTVPGLAAERHVVHGRLPAVALA